MRILMFIAIGYTVALTACNYFVPAELRLYFALVFIVSGLLGFVFKKRAKAVIMLLSFSAAAAFSWSYIHNETIVKPAEDLIDLRSVCEVRILDEPSFGDGYSNVLVKLRDEKLPSCRVLVTDYDDNLLGLKPGDIVNMELKFRSAKIRYNTEDDYYYSSGIFLRANLVGSCEKTDTSPVQIFYTPKVLAASLKEHILRLFPEDVAPLMKALLTGDKKELYEDDRLSVALRVSGLSHIVAVSGMHVSFVISLIALAWGRRRITAFLGIPLVWFFAAMMGFGPSVTRASLMISLMLLAPILKRENDPPTSISAALLLVLIPNPLAIGSLSLQLSFAAMVGIILITPRIFGALTGLVKGANRILGNIFRAVCGIFSATVGATVFTLPIAAANFGFIPLYSVLSNIFCMWAMSAAFILAYPICVIGAVYFPLGELLASLVAWLPRFTIAVVKLIARLPNAAVFTGSKIMAAWLVYVYLIMFCPLMFKGKEKYRPLIPICLCIISLPFCLYFSRSVEYTENTISVLDVGQGQCIIVSGESGSLMIDCGSKGSARNAGDVAAEYLLSRGRDSVELLILTHLHDDHANGVTRLMSYMDVERIAIPKDCESTEVGDRILDICYDSGTEVFFISENTNVRMESLSLDIFAPIGSADANEKGLIILGNLGETEFLVTGDAGTNVEEQLLSFYEIGEIDLLIAGHHGSKYSTGDVLLDRLKPETAFISVGINSYGHPSEEVLQRLSLRGIEVYRTDVNGNIIMTVGK